MSTTAIGLVQGGKIADITGASDDNLAVSYTNGVYDNRLDLLHHIELIKQHMVANTQGTSGTKTNLWEINRGEDADEVTFAASDGAVSSITANHIGVTMNSAGSSGAMIDINETGQIFETLAVIEQYIFETDFTV